MSRRGLLRAAAVGAALAVGPLGTPPAASAAAADVPGALVPKWRALILGSGFTPTAEPFASRLAALGATARDLRSAMARATGSLWPDLPFADPDPDTDPESYTYSGNLQTSYSRLRTLAEAHAQPGTGLTGDTGLRDDILAGLDHLHDEVYHAGQTRYGNWYSWQIGAPQALLDIDVLLHEHLGADRIAQHCAAVDHFVPDSAVAQYTGTSTGANRVDLCRVLALRGVVGSSAAKLALARDALSPVFPYVTNGDGLYADGSFVQHTWVPYAGSYGSVMLGGLSLLFALLEGSAWEVKDGNRQIVFDSVDKAYAPFLFNGLAMDAVSGRAVSRGAKAAVGGVRQDDQLRGQSILACIALLARSASAAEQSRWRGMVKGWISRQYYTPALTAPGLGIAALARLAEVAAGDATAIPEPVGHRLFPGMDRAVHRSAGWAACLSMASRRITYYENGNGENLRGWHSGSGMLYWWGDDFANGQYSDDFWATVDPYRLPGTTASRKPLADAEGGAWGAARPDVRWVGGTTDGTYASVGQYLKGLSSTLLAKKSWFLLDDTVVCLGAGIHARDGATVESVVENRNLGLAGVHAFTVDGRAQPGGLGWSAPLGGARWAHLAGHAGYVFPGGAPASLKALRHARTGAWSDINQGASPDPITRRYLALWFDHGTAPAGDTYAYLLMPGASPAQTAARAADNGWLSLLANTDDHQGVRVPSRGFTGVNFWNPGSVGGITVGAPASVTIREAERTATVCVSGPLRDGATIDLTWDRPVSAVVSLDPTVQLVAAGATLKLRISPGKLGAVHTAVVRPG
ncbi:polysaccharide lyase 8 family protein [Streptomyces finlayi]|nr:polysaccharide lyase 8 family protein [Streptomyces finlayi]